MSDERIRELERQVLAGDAAALERLKGEWLRRRDAVDFREWHARSCAYENHIQAAEARALREERRPFVIERHRVGDMNFRFHIDRGCVCSASLQVHDHARPGPHCGSSLEDPVRGPTRICTLTPGHVGRHEDERWGASWNPDGWDSSRGEHP